MSPGGSRCTDRRPQQPCVSSPDSGNILQTYGPPGSPEHGPICPWGDIFLGLSCSNCRASSYQVGRSPADICMNHNCPWPTLQVRVTARGGQGLTSEVPGIIYCLWLHELIWAFAQPWGNGFTSSPSITFPRAR